LVIQVLIRECIRQEMSEQVVNEMRMKRFRNESSEEVERGRRVVVRIQPELVGEVRATTLAYLTCSVNRKDHCIVL
jgi:hypothetical protein